MKLLRLLLGDCGMFTLAATAPARETVVLLHGLGRTNLSMLRLAAALEREGCEVVNLSYPSRTQSLETLATQWLPAHIPSGTRVHFVTHSMGGIVLRLWLRECGAPPNLGRIVMLAPPNEGSEIADKLARFPPYRWAAGHNGARLGTGPGDPPRTLGPWPTDAGDLGVIAGSRSSNFLLGALLPRPNDGKVSVASTHLAGERDHVVLPVSHTWIAWNGTVIDQVRAFLREGHFATPSGS